MGADPLGNRSATRFDWQRTAESLGSCEAGHYEGTFGGIYGPSIIVVSDLKVIQGPNGVFVSMPSKRKKNGEFKDIAHPLNRETRERMERRILSEYERVRSEMPAPAAAVSEEETAAQEAAG